jgi:hypothetical protein
MHKAFQSRWREVCNLYLLRSNLRPIHDFVDRIILMRAAGAKLHPVRVTGLAITPIVARGAKVCH